MTEILRDRERGDKGREGKRGKERAREGVGEENEKEKG